MKAIPFLFGKTIKPSENLTTIVHHYEWFETDEYLDQAKIPFFPNFTAGFAFLFYEDKPILVDKGHMESCVLSSCSFLPPLTTFFQNQRIQKLKVFRVIFQPGLFHKLYGIPMEKLTNKLFDPNDVIDPLLQPLHSQMREQTNQENCKQLFENYLTSRLIKLNVNSVKISQQLIQILERHNCPVKVNILAKTLSVDRKTLAKYIKLEIGLKTIQFISIYRFCCVLRYIHRFPNISLAQLALEFGYSDQAHLGNEFRKLAGCSPGKYLRLLKKHKNHNILDVGYSGLLIKAA